MAIIALFWSNARRVFSPTRVPDCFEGIVSSDSTKKIYMRETVFVLCNWSINKSLRSEFKLSTLLRLEWFGFPKI